MATTTKRAKKTTKTDGSINKAEEIRKAAKELGGRAVRPKDVIACWRPKALPLPRPRLVRR